MRWRFKSTASPLFTQPFIQEQIKENIKAPRHWPLWGDIIGHRRPVTRKCFHLMTSSCFLKHEASLIFIETHFMLFPPVELWFLLPKDWLLLFDPTGKTDSTKLHSKRSWLYFVFYDKQAVMSFFWYQADIESRVIILDLWVLMCFLLSPPPPLYMINSMLSEKKPTSHFSWPCIVVYEAT